MTVMKQLRQKNVIVWIVHELGAYILLGKMWVHHCNKAPMRPENMMVECRCKH